MRIILLLFLALPALAERSLYWDAIRVTAHLEADGRLHVVEEQTYVFDGEWNGGERGFIVHEGQELRVNSLHRRDKDGQLIAMQEGSVDMMDGWQRIDDQVRWRARMPDDPPFRKTRITYLIDYTMSGVLVKTGDTEYRLAHDFLFADRDGEIKLFTLNLTTDPVWHSDDLQRKLEIPDPGSDVVVKGTLHYRGANAPAAPLDPRYLRYGLIALVILFPLLKWTAVVRRERKLGRFAPLDKPTLPWIEQNILPIPAEVIGATWDESIESNEVSALIARWAAEGKVETSTRGSDLTMRLKVDRDEFEGYERELVDKLFFEGDSTSTSAIKAHYKKSGFNPSAIITPGVRVKADALLPPKESGPIVSLKVPTLIFLAAALYNAKQMADVNRGSTFFFFMLMFFTLVCWFIGWIAASMWRGRIDYGLEDTKAFQICVWLVAGTAVVALALGWFEDPGRFALVAASLFAANQVFNAAKSKKGPGAIAYRKRLASVRQYFVEELKRRDPAIDDRWVPYLIAFGLDSEATAWMKEFGGAASQRSSSFGTSSSGWSSSSGSSSTPRWTGGGGAFGGAGATAGWSAAAAGIAAGVAAPSSSSSGGGGGGGSSSGGGSGGGW